MVWSVAALTVIVLVIFSYLLIKSPGELPPSLTDGSGNIIPNSISERIEMEIGGITQGLFIRGENPENPVILYLHGGPGNPELPFVIPRESEERLEKYFTVCYWEQRGSGMSFSKSLDPSTMTVEQMVQDAHELTGYLKERFGKEKIYLMGHSWGSFLGIKTAERYPENYIAYIGMAQMSNQLESEILAYDYLMQHAKGINDNKAIHDLEKYDKYAPDFPNYDYTMYVSTRYADKYGVGTMHENSSMIAFVKDVLLFEGYTITDKMNHVRGSTFSFRYLFPIATADNLFESSRSFKIPVYFIHGKYDYLVSYPLAKKYLEEIEAPDKDFFPFDNAAHSPNMEDTEKFVKIVRDIDTQILSIE